MSDIDLSPDGTAIAYTFQTLSGHRSVVIGDLVTGERRKLSIPTQTSFGPDWSSDGRRIALNTFDGKKWNVALIGADGGGYQLLDTASKADGCMSPSWAPSGQWLCCMSVGAWRIGAKGEAVQLFSGSDLPGALLAIPRKCSVSVGDQTVIFETEVKDAEFSWHDGGRPVLFAVQSSGEDLRRVGPRNFAARVPRFLDGDHFLFLGCPLSARNRSMKDGMPMMNLYLGKLGTDDAVLLQSRVREFSVAKRRSEPSNPALNPTGLRPAG